MITLLFWLLGIFAVAMTVISLWLNWAMIFPKDKKYQQYKSEYRGDYYKEPRQLGNLSEIIKSFLLK
jgi:hypothetical protein